MRPSLVVLALLVVPLAARAQHDRAAGLFTEARLLPLVSQSMTVDVAGPEAVVRVVQTFVNDGPALGQADYHLYLPDGGSVVGFGFWEGDRFLASKLREKSEAEARHAKAADEGRATGIVRTERNIQTFSVFPVRAGERKRVEVTLRLPIARELGRQQLLLPVDEFLGQPGPDSTVVVELTSDEPLAEVGMTGAKPVVLARTKRSARLAASTRQPLTVWWREEGPALLLRAESTSLGDGTRAVQLRVALDDAGEWKARHERLELLVDASFSMRRRSAALGELLGRLHDQAPVPVRVHAVAERAEPVPSDGDPRKLVRALLSGRYGHVASWKVFEATARDLGCDSPKVNCLALTDPQLEGLPGGELALPTLLLADPHELSHLEGRLPTTALVFQPGTESAARLFALADRLVLPSIEIRELAQAGEALELPGRQERRAAEGGMLRLFAATSSAEPISVRGTIAGQELERVLPIVPVPDEGETGKAIRRGFIAKRLAAWMESYRRSPDGELKKLIVDTSLREGIPTAFTALQVDDPALSLAAIKPGDPQLTVHGEPGLREVTAWYPFGEWRRLVADGPRDVWIDRFLVPRGWNERSYRIDVFKTFADGTVRREEAWYRLDERGPSALVRLDGHGALRIEPGRDGEPFAAILVHGANGRVLTLSPIAGVWSVPVADLPGAFSVVVRDFAGNRTTIACRLERGRLRVDTSPRRRTPPAPPPLTTLRATHRPGGPLSLDGDTLHLAHAGTDHAWPVSDATVSSLELRSLLDLGGGRLLFGTTGGDLVALTCEAGRCQARAITREFSAFPITGLARLGDRVLIGVLGRGLSEWDGRRVRRSPLRVGSAFVTGLASVDGELFVGTAYEGLWRSDGTRTVRERFPHEHVAALSMRAGRLVVESGFGTFRRLGRDRFTRDAGPTLREGSPALTTAVEHEGRLFVGGFDRGLFVLEGRTLAPAPLPLGTVERHVNALVSFAGALWIGTEAGLLAVRDGGTPARVLAPAVHDLAVGPDGLAVATTGGLFVVAADGSPRRVDFQSGAGTSRFMSVAWWRGALYAGGMEGLYVFEHSAGRQLGRAEGFDAGWVTALLPRGDALLVGTYDAGVHELRDGRVRTLGGLAHQWVPPRGLREVGGAVWIGGLGMAPVRLRDGRAEAIGLPVRDVNDVVGVAGGVVLLTSEGPVFVDAPAVEGGVARR